MLREIPGVSRREHMRKEYIRCISHLSPIDEVRSGRLRWFWTCPKKRCEQRHPHSYGPGNTRRRDAPRRHMAPTYEGRHDGRGCYPGCGPRPELEKNWTRLTTPGIVKTLLLAKRTAGHLRVSHVIYIVTHTSPLKTRAHGH